MREFPAVLRDQCGVMTSEQAQAVGWTSHQLRSAVRSGRLERLWRGVFATPVPAGAQGVELRMVQRAVAASQSNHGLTVSHLASARLAGVAWWAPDARPCVTTSTAGVTLVGDVHVHRSPLPRADVVHRRGVQLTAPGRTVVDIAREFGTEAALVSADSALRSGRITHADLMAAVHGAAGRPGITAARALPQLADADAESVLESRSRYRLHLAGLPRPLTQRTILDEYGNFVARVDFYWEEYGVVGEADGRAKYRDDDSARWREKRRQEALMRLGLGYESWGWVDLSRFDPTVHRLLDAFSRGETNRSLRRWRVATRGAA